LALPARAVAQRFPYFLLVLAALALLFLGRTQPEAVEALRGRMADIAVPVLDLLSRPVEATRRLVAEAQRILDVYEENARLREENARLLQWQDIARRLEQDNAAYRALLNVRREPQSTFITARVVGDVGSPFVRTLLLNAGRRDGVRRGFVALSGDGVIGRVVAVGERSARLLLLSDLNSRIPVILEPSRHRAVLAGDNSGWPRLLFLPHGTRLAPGERVVTSSHGGAFPEGLMVGVVALGSEGELRVQPSANLERLDIVTVVHVEMPQVPFDAPRPFGAAR
jgi:rod shape-determining protein MreC